MWGGGGRFCDFGMLQSCANDVRLHCQEGLDQQGCCLHMVSALSDASAVDGVGCGWQRLLRMMQGAYLRGKTCLAAKAFLGRLAYQLADGVAEQVGNMGAASNLNKINMPMGLVRKRRLDEDDRRHLMRDAVRQKKVHCGARLALATGEVHPETARKWGEAFVKESLAAAWDSRVGNPAEETTIFYLWDMAPNTACVLPPQAILVGRWPHHMS